MSIIKKWKKRREAINALRGIKILRDISKDMEPEISQKIETIIAVALDLLIEEDY